MEERFGKYLLRAELGRGASSVVYLAFDEFLNADLALKIYLPEAAPDKAMTADVQFVSEAALAGRLDHPHIVTIIDAVAEPEHRYVAMEYVPGGSLQRYTHPDRLLPLPDLAQIAFKTCSALDYASRLGIVHRDIKPSNILLDSDGEMKLADFGAAFIRGVRTTERYKLASPSYSAPEQLQEAPPTAQSDMFSLGVTLYELLTGRKPFGGTTVEEKLAAILRDTPLPPSAHRPDLAPEFDAIIGRMLQKRPEDRYANWAEAALALAEVGRLSIFRQEIPASDKLAAIRQSSLTREFDDVEAWDAVRHGLWRRIPAQQVIVREGDRGDSLMLIAEGEAFVTAQGRLLNVLRGGDCFGEMAYVQGPESIRSATVQTKSDTLVVEFTRDVLARLAVNTRLKLSEALLKVLAERLTLANARVARSG